MTIAEIDRIDALIPEARWRVYRVIQALEAAGFEVFVGSTARTQAEVAKAVASGNSSANQKHSWHQLGRAVDLRPRLPNGGPDYSTGPLSEVFWRALQVAAEKFGMRCLAYRKDGQKFYLKTSKGRTWDPGHCEFRSPYVCLADAIKAELK